MTPLSQIMPMLVNNPTEAEIVVKLKHPLTLDPSSLDYPNLGYNTYQSMTVNVVPGSIPRDLQIFPANASPPFPPNYDPGYVFIQYFLGRTKIGQQKLDPVYAEAYFQALDPYVQSFAGRYRYGSWAEPEATFASA